MATMSTERWRVLGGVRNCTPGTRFTLTGSPLDKQLDKTNTKMSSCPSIPATTFNSARRSAQGM